MSAIANIVVFDGAATPVSHTLNPVSVTRDKGKVTAMWRENIATLPAEAQVYCIATVGLSTRGTFISTLEVGVPVMEAIAGNNASGYTAAPKVAYVDKNVWTNYAHQRSTLNSRRLARQLLTNISNNVSTSVAPATTGMFAELIDMLLTPT